MKEIYSKPVVEVELFKAVDVLTLSQETTTRTEENLGEDF